MSISKQELGNILARISAAGRKTSLDQIMRGEPDRPLEEDAAQAAELGSPLTTMLMGLYLLKREPDRLEQRHLDALLPIAGEDGTSTHDLHALGGELVQRFLKAGLVIEQPGHGGPQFRLSDELVALAQTPLEDVHRMAGEINAGPLAPPKKPPPPTGSDYDDDDWMGSPGGGGSARKAPPRKKECEKRDGQEQAATAQQQTDVELAILRALQMEDERRHRARAADRQLERERGPER